MGEHFLEIGGYIQWFLLSLVEHADIQIAVLMNKSPDPRSKRQYEPDFVFFPDRGEFLFSSRP